MIKAVLDIRPKKEGNAEKKATYRQRALEKASYKSCLFIWVVKDEEAFSM